MRKGDFLWIGGIVFAVLFIVSPQTNPIFLSMTSAHPYMMSFAKFAILATMGELLALRIRSGKWSKSVGMMYKAVVWGFFGILITLAFQLFSGGVVSALAKGYLPGNGSSIAFAFFTASTMNLFFAPVFMACHKCTDSYINLRVGGTIKKPSLNDVLKDADWNSYVNFVLLKTIPFFWIPAHTVTFLLPSEYRIVAAAFLSIALGVFLALANKKKTVSPEPCSTNI
jgi:hypothetical protein